jgi:hypothetical protein
MRRPRSLRIRRRPLHAWLLLALAALGLLWALMGGPARGAESATPPGRNAAAQVAP